MRRRDISNLMRKCSRLAQDHKEAVTKLTNLLDEEYGASAYDRIDQNINGDPFIEAVNYGGTPPTIAQLDKILRPKSKKPGISQ